GVEFWDDVLLSNLFKCPQYPFCVVGSGNAPHALRGVFKPELHNLNGSIDGCKQRQCLFELTAVLFENSVTVAVTDEYRRIRSGRKRRGGPDFSSLLVTEINDLGGHIDHRIVTPRGQTVFAAVARP